MKRRCLYRFCVIAWSLILVPMAAAQPSDDLTVADIIGMPLEDLASVVFTKASLTLTSRRLIPGAATAISHQMIERSGARHLNELLDIYVPNLQISRHSFTISPLGMRGILKDDDNAYLFMVNGRILNRRSSEGAQTERELPMMGDIHHIEIIRGPNSALYGPGGVAGIINIVTFDGESFEGADVKLRYGHFEEFIEAEGRFSHRWGEDSSLFIEFGLADYDGADTSDAPYFIGRSFAVPNGLTATAGEPFDFNIVDDHSSDRDQLKRKLHVQYKNGPFELWARYTKGGETLTQPRRNFEAPPFGVANSFNLTVLRPGVAVGYQQITTQASYVQKFSDRFNVEATLSFDLLDWEKLPAGAFGPFINNREEEYLARLLARWEVNSVHKIAFGAEYSRERFGLAGLGFPDAPTRTDRQGPGLESWHTDSFALFGEHQWHISSQWTSFLDLRVDKHTYTKYLVSPRVTLAYTPRDADTVKLILSQAVRRGQDDELRLQWLGSGTDGDAERLQSIELRYERRHSETLEFAVSGFVYSLDLVAYNFAIDETEGLGEQNVWGLEFEGTYAQGNTRISFSHSFTKLIDFELADPATIQTISAEPYGFGNDLAAWSNHVTKLVAIHDFDERWTVSASLRVYWGFPGGRDLSEFWGSPGEPLTDQNVPRIDPGFEKPFNANVYLNLGVQYELAKSLSLRFDAFNVLGWIDKDLNKRNFVTTMSDYRSEAPAIAVTLKYGL